MPSLVTFLCLLVIASILPQGRDTAPTATEKTTYDPMRFLQLCSAGSPRRNICEKCTKVTKDPNTYKMCCENAEEVLPWCQRFLNPSEWISPNVS